MSSSKKSLRLSTGVAVIVMSFHAPPVVARATMATTSFDSLTKEMPTLQAIFFDMQEFVGVPMQ